MTMIHKWYRKTSS